MARRRSECAISFFAFQDVMMSVCGIVVLVALLLVLKLVMQMAAAEAVVPAGMTQQDFATMQEQVNGLIDTRRKIQDETMRLRTLRAAHPGMPWIPSQEQIDAAARGVTQAKSENKHLGSTISSAEEKRGALENSPANALVREAEGRIVDLQSTRDELKKQQGELATASTNAQTQKGELEMQSRVLDDQLKQAGSKKGELETRSRALDGQLADARNRSKVKLVVRQSTPKKPFVIVYDQKGITMMAFTEPEQHFDSERAFLDWAKSKNNSEEYFVIYVRPSRLHAYESLIRSLQSMRFDVGFDLTGEGTYFTIQ